MDNQLLTNALFALALLGCAGALATVAADAIIDRLGARSAKTSRLLLTAISWSGGCLVVGVVGVRCIVGG